MIQLELFSTTTGESILIEHNHTIGDQSTRVSIDLNPTLEMYAWAQKRMELTQNGAEEGLPGSSYKFDFEVRYRFTGCFITEVSMEHRKILTTKMICDQKHTEVTILGD